MATDNLITRRAFLKATGLTLGAAGVALVIPPSWVDELDAFLEEPEDRLPLLPIRLLDGDRPVGFGVASASSTNPGRWRATFVPGDFVGRVDAIEYVLLGRRRRRAIPEVNVTPADSLELNIDLDVRFNNERNLR